MLLKNKTAIVYGAGGSIGGRKHDGRLDRRLIASKLGCADGKCEFK